MVLIRAWLLIVTVAAVLFGAVVLATPAFDQQRLATETGRRVESAAQSAELLLRLHTQKWIETAAQFATDSVLGDALDEANRESHELAMLSKSLQGRLRGVRDKTHADLAVILDAKGRVVAESGAPELKPRTPLVEREGVAAALRGTRGDAYWLLGGHAFRVALAPASRERGVVVLGQALGPELLATIRDTVGADLALATAEQIVAAAPALAQVSQIPARVAAQRGARKDEARALQPERLGAGQDSVLFAGRWLGERSQAQALVLCALAPQPSFDSPLGRVEATLRQLGRSLRGQDGLVMVVLIVLGVLIGLVAFGQYLISLDGARPLRRLLGEAQLVARGDQQRLTAERLPKRFAVLTRTLNAAFDRFGQRARAAQTAAAGTPTEVPKHASWPTTQSAQPQPPPAAPPPERTPPPSLTPLSPTAAAEAAKEEESVWAVAPQLGDMFVPPPKPPVLPPPKPAPAPVETPVAAALPPEDEELRGVYRDFVETRETCGEATEGLTWEKFLTRMQQTRALVQKQHSCTEVRYSVYVKDGKAAIKVTPVK